GESRRSTGPRRTRAHVDNPRPPHHDPTHPGGLNMSTGRFVLVSALATLAAGSASASTLSYAPRGADGARRVPDRLGQPSVCFSPSLGGNLWEILRPAVVAPSGDIYVTGWTYDSDFPTKNAYQPAYGGGPADMTVARYDPSGAVLSTTYLGGSQDDAAFELAV